MMDLRPLWAPAPESSLMAEGGSGARVSPPEGVVRGFLSVILSKTLPVVVSPSITDTHAAPGGAQEPLNQNHFFLHFD